MALIHMEAYSEVLGMNRQTLVIVPENAEPEHPAKVLFLLHGLTDDASCWDRRSRVEQYADGRNVVVVMPEGDRSFYTDSPLGNYRTYLERELPEQIARNFNISSRRKDTYIGGLSMGGYGALKIGLRNPESYRRVFAFSSALGYEQNLLRFCVAPGIPFSEETREEEDLLRILERDLAAKKTLPTLHLFCGKQDSFFAENQRFDALLSERGVPHTAQWGDGCAHEWRYWDAALCESLRILAEDA